MTPTPSARWGRAAERLIAERYSLDVTTPQMVQMYEEARDIGMWAGNAKMTANVPLPVFPGEGRVRVLLPSKIARQGGRTLTPPSPGHTGRGR